jgi:hypothetical protein
MPTVWVFPLGKTNNDAVLFPLNVWGVTDRVKHVLNARKGDLAVFIKSEYPADAPTEADAAYKTLCEPGSDINTGRIVAVGELEAVIRNPVKARLLWPKGQTYTGGSYSYKDEPFTTVVYIDTLVPIGTWSKEDFKMVVGWKPNCNIQRTTSKKLPESHLLVRKIRDALDNGEWYFLGPRETSEIKAWNAARH